MHEFINSYFGPDQILFYFVEGRDEDVIVPAMSGSRRHMNIGAGELLLSAAAQEHLKLIVLEGVPGQGKSTLAQYVCQVHRARYLNKIDLLERVPENHKQTALRMPFKVDLRDLAAFLEGRSPFDDAAAPTGAVRSLEVFLGQLVTYGSGGIEFKASDVLALFKSTPVLLFLDGLDEVADIEHRERLVNSVMESLNRLGEFETDLQVVVTSRPSVFGKAPSFGRFGFLTLTLNKIDRDRIEEYAEKWVTARGLEPAEQKDVKKILAEKLELAHIRDLTRNPMQLTILLSLIHQIGHSLPDQRTDLYRRYVDLVLAREADKSIPVREHRPLLIGFTQHLAWVLQNQAESSRSSGSISAENLQEMAHKYLEKGSHPVALADDLFGGSLERIFVLVKRIGDLYEFEVQPLREYFCAQHLYETAPVGTYRDATPCGDRAQRFEAIAANPFWLNVSRFYAGLYASGEVGSLVVSLDEMINTENTPGALHARRVGVALLKDWVFSNKKFAQKRLISIIFDEIGLQSLIAADRGMHEEIQFEVECGQDVLRSILFEQLKNTSVDVHSNAYCRALRQNGGQQLRDEFCQLLNGTDGHERTNLLTRMFRSGAAHDLPAAESWQLLAQDDPARLELIERSWAFLASEEQQALACNELVEVLVRGVLDGLVPNETNLRSLLGVFADVLGALPSRPPGRHIYIDIDFLEDIDADPDAEQFPAHLKDFMRTIKDAVFQVADPNLNQQRSISLWNVIAEAARENFGESWATRSLAIRTAGIRASVDIPSEADALFNPAVPICSRARAARLRRGGESWWLEQLRFASSNLDRMFWAGLVVAWASVKNLYTLSDYVNEIVHKLSLDEFFALRRTLEGVAEQRTVLRGRKKLRKIDLSPFSKKAAVLVALVFDADITSFSFSDDQASSDPFSKWLSSRRQYEHAKQFPAWSDEPEISTWLRLVAEIRALGGPLPRRAAPYMRKGRPSPKLASEIMANAASFPIEAVMASQSVMQSRYRPRSLSKIAEEQNWLFE